MIRRMTALLLLAVAVSCSPPPPPDAPVTASAYRSRDDDAVGGQFQVTLTGASDQPVSVTAVALESPGFAPAGPTQRAIALSRGSRVDITTRFGDALCAVDPEPASVRVSTSDGSDLVMPLISRYETLARIHDEQCAQQRLAAEVSLALTPSDPFDGAATLRMDRRDGSNTLRLDEIRGSLLYDVTSAAVPATLAPDEHTVTVPVRVATASCEPHVIADATKPFVFPAWIAVGDDSPVYTRIPVPDAAQRTLVEYQQRTCVR